MKKVLLFGLLTCLLCLGSLTSCGGDTDEEFSENLLGWWQGPFVQGGYSADSLQIEYSITDSTTRLKFMYPLSTVVCGKSGVGEQYDKSGMTSFEWQVKFGTLYITHSGHPDRDLVIYNYGFPVDSIFEGRIDIADSTASVTPYYFHLRKIGN